MRTKIVGESGDGGGTFTRGGEQDSWAGQVHEKGDILLAPARGSFINAKAADGGMVGSGER